MVKSKIIIIIIWSSLRVKWYRFGCQNTDVTTNQFSHLLLSIDLADFVISLGMKLHFPVSDVCNRTRQKIMITMIKMFCNIYSFESRICWTTPENVLMPLGFDTNTGQTKYKVYLTGAWIAQWYISRLLPLQSDSQCRHVGRHWLPSIGDNFSWFSGFLKNTRP